MAKKAAALIDERKKTVPKRRKKCTVGPEGIPLIKLGMSPLHWVVLLRGGGGIKCPAK